MEIEEIIEKLQESIQNEVGDLGRTSYVIEKIQNNRQLPKSDQKYMQKILEYSKPTIEEEQISENIEEVAIEDLIKCHHCDLEIVKINKNNIFIRRRFYHH